MPARLETADTRVAPRVENVRRPRSLAQQLALWIALSTATSLMVFAAIAYVVAVGVEYSEPADEQDPPDVINHEAQVTVGRAILIAGPVCLLLAVGGAVVFTRRTLRPLDEVVRAAALITPRELNRRLPVSAAYEVQTVVVALNRLLERLEQGFTALGRFAGDASHELRTPLAVIGVELEVMLRSSHSREEWDAAARTCLQQIQHLTRLVDTLLQMARAEGTTNPAGAVADLQAVIDHVISTIGPRARERGVYLGGAPSGQADGAQIVADPDAVASALSNVVDNAVQYTPVGGEILVWWSPDGEGKLVVHVDDSGPGIPVEDEQRIFEPFTRGATAGEATSGFGLGLAIARNICERNDATIRVGRSPSGGARFSLAFPAARA